MKKILVITPFFYPHIGGSEKYMEGLYTFIKRNNPKIQIDVLTYNTNNAIEKEVYKGLTIYRIPCLNILPDQFSIPNPYLIFKFLKEKGDSYDLIHCSTRFFDSSWWAPIYARIRNKKIILTDHCSYHPIHKNPLISLIAKFVDLTVVSLSLHLYDQVYSQNKKNKKFLDKTFGIKSEVAYPGLEENFYKKTTNGRVKTVFIGRLIESKGVKNLFDIVTGLPEADFVFAGPGPLFLDLQNRIKKEKITNIKLSGALLEREIEKLLSESDIFAYPSVHSEGIPMAILEAGKYGLAVVATNSGAIDEVISDKTGILVNDLAEFKTSLVELINNKSLRKKLGSNFQKLITKNFTWDKAANLVFKEV